MSPLVGCSRHLGWTGLDRIHVFVMLYFSTISMVEVGDPSSKKHSECSAMSLPTPPLLDPAPWTLPSTPRPAAVVQPDIGDGMRPLADTPQKDNRIGWHACPTCDFRTKRNSTVAVGREP